MPRIVQVFNTHKRPLSSRHIAQTIGSCSSDAKETLKMMQYITSYGRVVLANGKWRREMSVTKIPQDKPKFRFRYIKEVIQLIENLPEDFVSLDELASLHNREKSEIEQCLSFVVKITQNGQISSQGNLLSQLWTITPWETLDETEN